MRNIVWVDVNELDLSAGQPALKLDLNGDEDLVGNVTERFQASEPFAFAAP